MRRDDPRESSVVTEESKQSPKLECYSLNVIFKDLPDSIKGLPQELEGAVSS